MTGENTPPKPLSVSLSEITVLFAEKWGSTPFAVLNQDIDDFILIANSMIAKNANKPKSTVKPKQQERIRVNDKTATGGWF